MTFFTQGIQCDKNTNVMIMLPTIDCDMGFRHRWLSVVIIGTISILVFGQALIYNIYINNIIHQPAGWRTPLANGILASMKYITCVICAHSVRPTFFYLGARQLSI